MSTYIDLKRASWSLLWVLCAVLFLAACTASEGAETNTLALSTVTTEISTPTPGANVTTSEATVTVPEEAAVVVTTSPATTTATVVTELDIAIANTNTPTAVINTELPSFEIAYAVYLDSAPTFEIWVASYPELIPQGPVSGLADNPFLDSAFSWSHDGQHIAYVDLKSDETVELSVTGITGTGQEEVAYALPIPSDLVILDFVGVIGWSLNDDWIAINIAYRTSNMAYVTNTIILDVSSGELLELDSSVGFMDWSHINPNEFLYILRPNYPESGGESIHIGSVGQTAPIHSFADFDGYIPKSTSFLSPSGSKLILVVQAGEQPSDEANLLLDLQQKSWSLLPNVQDIYLTPTLWSPDENWVVFVGQDSLFLWSAVEPNQPMIEIQTASSFPTALTWLREGNILIYQDGGKIYMVGPATAEEPILLLELADLGIPDEARAAVKIWVP